MKYSPESRNFMSSICKVCIAMVRGVSVITNVNIPWLLLSYLHTYCCYIIVSTVNFKSATYSAIEGQATVTITVTNSGVLQRSGTVA